MMQSPEDHQNSEQLNSAEALSRSVATISAAEKSRSLRPESQRYRISVSPSSNIENIPEVSPADSCQLDGVHSSIEEVLSHPETPPPVKSKTDQENSPDDPDSSPVYRRTTESHPYDDGDDTLLIPRTAPHQTSSCRIVGSVKDFFAEQKHAMKQIRCTDRQIIIMVVLVVVTLTSSFAVCLFPPFFPKIAQEKGASTTVFGLIIGTNCLVAFLVTPVVGKNIERIGVKFSFVMGAFASGGCCILSGFLEWFPPGNLFIIEAAMIRAVHAFSNAFVITSTFAFIVVEFPDNVAKLFALTRTTMNLAQMLGPVLGGALYELGGFKLPFLVLGSIQMIVALICVKVLPRYKPKERSAEDTVARNINLIDVLSIPGMWVSFCTFVFSTMSNGFLSITLEPLVLRPFHFSYLQVGLLFGLKDGANSLASPFWGFLCDRMRNLRPLILVSTVMAAASFVLLGPFPGLEMKSTSTLVILALVLNGFGIGGQQVSGVMHAMNVATTSNLPDDAATHGLIAGLWSSLSGAGRFISRAGSGLLVDQIGFRNVAAIVVALHCIVFTVTSAFMLHARAKDPHSKEKPVRPVRQHGPQCTHNLCVCGSPPTVTSIGINTPSDSVTSKAVSIPITGVREDLEGSFSFGSMRSTGKASPALSTREPV